MGMSLEPKDLLKLLALDKVEENFDTVRLFKGDKVIEIIARENMVLIEGYKLEKRPMTKEDLK